MARPTQANYDLTDMRRWLQNLQQTSRATHAPQKAPFIYDTTITYDNGGKRSGWTNYDETASERGTLSAFKKAPLNGTGLTRLGIVDSWNGTYVGKPTAPGTNQWDSEEDHTFGIAITWDLNKKCTWILVDCDEDIWAGKRWRTLTNGRARRFIDESRKKGGYKPTEVWMCNLGPQYRGVDKCVDATTNWLARVAGHYPNENVDTTNVDEHGALLDPRFRGAVRLPN